MPDPPKGEVTSLLQHWSGGDRQALERLMPLVYGELRRVAGAYLKAERPDHTLQPTALVHEAYLRLIDQKRVVWQNRAHFFGIAAQMMRRILVDHARRRQASKRDAERLRILSGAGEASAENAPDLLALDSALQGLQRLDPRQARIVELRFFAGLTVEETAEVANVSPATVKREWRTARAWLRREIGDARAGTERSRA